MIIQITLKVLEKAHNLKLEIYKIISNFLTKEKLGTSDQTIKASYSGPANTIEGQNKNITKDQTSFLYMLLSKVLEYNNTKIFKNLDKEITTITIKTLNSLIKIIRREAYAK